MACPFIGRPHPSPSPISLPPPCARPQVYQGHSSHVKSITFLKDDFRVVSAGGNDKALFQFRVVSAPVAGGEALLMHAGTKGARKTTGFGGGFDETANAATRDGGDDYDDEPYGHDDDGFGATARAARELSGVAELKRWGESIVLPATGLVRPAWTNERYSKMTPAEVEAAAAGTGRRSSGGLAGGAYRTSRKPLY